MKLIHTLAAIAALVAMLAVSVAGSSAQDTVYYVAKKKPKLTLHVKPKRDRHRPFKFTAAGKLKKPSSVSRSRGCKGTVTITFKKHSKTVGKGKAKVHSNCKYAKKVKVSKRGKHIRVHARFNGNSRLKKASAKTRTVRAG
jgi:hypothetical protein